MGAGSSRVRLQQAVTTLLSEDVAWSNTDFWNGLWDASLTSEDLFMAFDPPTVQRMRARRPENLQHVCALAVAQLCQFVETPLPTYTANALNCVRVLTRVLPVLLEHRGGALPFARHSPPARTLSPPGPPPLNGATTKAPGADFPASGSDAKTEDAKAEPPAGPGPLETAAEGAAFAEAQTEAADAAAAQASTPVVEEEAGAPRAGSQGSDGPEQAEANATNEAAAKDGQVADDGARDPSGIPDEAPPAQEAEDLGDAGAALDADDSAGGALQGDTPVPAPEGADDTSKEAMVQDDEDATAAEGSGSSETRPGSPDFTGDPAASREPLSAIEGSVPSGVDDVAATEHNDGAPRSEPAGGAELVDSRAAGGSRAPSPPLETANGDPTTLEAAPAPFPKPPPTPPPEYEAPQLVVEAADGSAEAGLNGGPAMPGSMYHDGDDAGHARSSLQSDAENASDASPPAPFNVEGGDVPAFSAGAPSLASPGAEGPASEAKVGAAALEVAEEEPAPGPVFTTQPDPDLNDGPTPIASTEPQPATESGSPKPNALEHTPQPPAGPAPVRPSNGNFLPGEDPFMLSTFWSELDSATGEGGGPAEDEPLARLLVHAVMHLCFVPGFTIDEGSEVAEDAATIEATPDFHDPLKLPLPPILWHSGAGTSNAFPHGHEYNSNRIEVLRLLVAMLSQPLWMAAAELPQRQCKWSEAATAMDSPFASSLFYSLLNTALSHSSASWMQFGGASSNAQSLVDLSLQALAILMDYAEPEDEERPESDNIFHHLCGRMHVKADYEFVFDAVVRLLETVCPSSTAFLPKPAPAIRFHQELLVVFWKLLAHNRALEMHILKECDVTRIVGPLCCIMLDARRDVSRVGLVHLCTFVLLRLSGERDFAVALNRTPPSSTPVHVDLPPHRGTFADLVLLTLHKLIVNAVDGVRPMHHCFLIIASNLSPYVKTMSIVTSVKVVSLFDVFTSPRYLYAKEENHQLVALLLDFFNNVIQYQYAGNANLVCAVLKRAQLFTSLSTLTLEDAMKAADLNRSHLAVRLAKHHHRRTVMVTGQAGGDAADEPALDLKGMGVLDFDPMARAAQLTFTPTEAWLKKVTSELPLNTITCLIDTLVPEVIKLSRRKPALESEVVEYLRSSTLVGLLPVPHAITIRRYQANDYVHGWFTAFLWGVTFMRNQTMPLFDGQRIRLFRVTSVAADNSG